MRDTYPGYARLVPSKWAAKPGARKALAEHPGHPALLARANSLTYGISRGGGRLLAGNRGRGRYPTVALTQWFERKPWRLLMALPHEPFTHEQIVKESKLWAWTCCPDLRRKPHLLLAPGSISPGR
jgi:hypothetical protein